MLLDYNAVKKEAHAMLRDEDGVYTSEVEAGLRYSLRMLQEQGVLETQTVKVIPMKEGTYSLEEEQGGYQEVVQIDWAYIDQYPEIWRKLQKSPLRGADFNIRIPPAGRPYRWSVWGGTIVLDGTLQQDYQLRLYKEYQLPVDGSLDNLPSIDGRYYDAVLQLTVAYVQQNYLNIDASGAKGQATAAVQRLIEARDRQLSSGEVQPLLY